MLHELPSSPADDLNELLFNSEDICHHLSITFRPVIDKISNLVQRHRQASDMNLLSADLAFPIAAPEGYYALRVGAHFGHFLT